MSGRLTEKLVASVLVLFLLIYVGVQASRFFSTSVKTETVYEYTISQTINAQGVVFRDEKVIPAASAGVESCLYNDSERVLVGQPVVEYLASSQGGGSRSRLEDVQWEISMLGEAQNTSLSHFSNADALGRDIKQQLGSLVQMAASGNYDALQAVRPNLTSLLNKRQIATGKESSFQTRISQLQSELASLEAMTKQETTAVVEAPESGYYARQVDGCESALTSDIALTADLDELLETIENFDLPEKKGEWSAGRIVTNQNWYIAVKVDKYSVQWVREGQAVELTVGNQGTRIPATVKRHLSNNLNQEDAVLVLHSNYITADTINLRNPEVFIYFQQFTGLRVDTARLRFVEGVQGVYVLDNNTVRFKRVDPVYEEENFILSRQPSDLYDTTTLSQYDQIITKGTDLEDGKVFD